MSHEVDRVMLSSSMCLFNILYYDHNSSLTILGPAYLSISKDRGNTFPKKLLFHLFLVMTGDQICRGACLTCWVDVLGLRFTFLCPYKETTAGACHRSLPLQSTPQVQIRANNPLQYDKTTPFEIDGGWTDMPREEYKMLTYFLMWKMDFKLGLACLTFITRSWEHIKSSILIILGSIDKTVSPLALW